MTVSEAQHEQRRQAARQHGLKSEGEQPPARVALSLASRPALVGQVETLANIALWVARELRDDPPFSRGERMAVTYADIGGRCNEAAVTITGRRFAHRYHDAAQAIGDGRQAAIERQAVIVAFILGKVKGAHGWLQVNGLRFNGAPRPVLGYYGEYIEKARRNCTALAALLSDDEDASDPAAIVGKYRTSENGTANDTQHS